jgi:hypothetical protein
MRWRTGIKQHQDFGFRLYHRAMTALERFPVRVKKTRQNEI